MYQDQKNYKPRNYTDKKTDRPRNAVMVFPLVATGVTNNGYEYNVDELYNMFADLNKNNVFDMLSFPVQISRALLDNNSSKAGNSTVAFVSKIDVESFSLRAVVYGNFVSRIDSIENLCVKPRLLVKDGHVVTILGLDIVKEAIADASDDVEDNNTEPED